MKNGAGSGSNAPRYHVIFSDGVKYDVTNNSNGRGAVPIWNSEPREAYSGSANTYSSRPLIITKGFNKPSGVVANGNATIFVKSFFLLTTKVVSKIILPNFPDLHIFGITITSNSDPIVPNAAPTPVMGVNTWFDTRGGYNEKLFRDIADGLVSTGLDKLGYVYVNIDDDWQDAQGRDAVGNILPNRSKAINEKWDFQSGMQDIADYVHGKGLKFGLYTATGGTTCESFPGHG